MGDAQRLVRMFLFEEALLTPEFLVRSYSGLAADFLNLPDRGYLREGYVADIAFLDPERYRDHATFDSPREMSTGAVHVLVNGEFAIRDEQATGVTSGLPLTRTGVFE